MKNIHRFGTSTSASLLACVCVSCQSGVRSANPPEQLPNILWITSEDNSPLLGCYGDTFAVTPNLDRMASEGLRLCEFYNNSISAPTRASLLTGQYQHKAGVGYFANDLGLPAYQGYINRESLTLAEVLQTAGYTTISSGKWHVDGKGTSLPWQRGFERSFHADNGSYFDQGDYYGGGESIPTTLTGMNTRSKRDRITQQMSSPTKPWN